MTGRIFEDPGLGKILTSSNDKIQKSVTLRQLDYADSFFFFLIKMLSTGIPTTYSYPLERKFQTCWSLDWSNLMISTLDKKLSTGFYTSQLFYLQMKVTMLTTYIFYCSIKMWILPLKEFHLFYSQVPTHILFPQPVGQSDS